MQLCRCPCSQLVQPSFTLIDELRTEKAMPLVRDVVEELDVAYTRHADAQDCIEHSAADVYFLEEQIHALQSKLEARCDELDRLDDVMNRAAAVMNLGYEVTPGLCVR